jgi:hypothetical protein
MVGEFAGEFGLAYAVLVNLSQERSAIFSLVVRPGGGGDAAASVDDGQFDPIDVTNGIRLAAGQGVLLRLRRQDWEES